MVKARISDQTLWLALIEDGAMRNRLAQIAPGGRIDLLIDNVPLEFERMADGPDGEVSPGFKPVGAGAESWRSSFYPGEQRDVELAYQRRNPAMRVTAMPADANPYGDIFGGWLMSLMDSGAGLVAARLAKGRAVTVAMDGMEFHRPVKVGDEVSVYAQIEKIGRTSICIFTEVWRRERHSEEAEMVTQAKFTFVAIDDDGRPRLIER